jgi:hypothetical protein
MGSSVASEKLKRDAKAVGLIAPPRPHDSAQAFELIVFKGERTNGDCGD